MVTGLVVTALYSVCAAQPATPMPANRAAGQPDKRKDLVILSSYGSAARLKGAWQSGGLSSLLIGAGRRAQAWEIRTVSR
jgi:hypothetical protein